MLTDNEIEQKYKIVYVYGQRYYYEDLSKRDFGLECTTPFSLEAGGKSFIETSWKQLLIQVVSSFLKDYPSKRDVLLNYKMQWNGKKPFTEVEGKNCCDVGFDLYLICNHSALHACWTLIDILEIFGVDLKKTTFIIHRPPYAEPIECRQFYEEKTKKAFRYYYTQLLKYPEEQAERVLRYLNSLNRIMPRVSKAYDNLLLIDNNATYANCKIRFLDYLKNEAHADEKNISLAEKYLNCLENFYKRIR